MKFKTEPYKHQQDCFDRNKEKRYYGYLMEMGTGKSKVLLDTAAELFLGGKIDALLIFANKGSYTNWTETEIPTHLSDEINAKVFLWKANHNKTEKKAFAGIEDSILPGEFKIFVMNIEALAYERSFRVAHNFAKNHRTLSVVDESTTIKNKDAKRTKSALKIRDVSLARRIMTGSIVDNNPLDVFSQFEFLEKGCLGFTSFYTFRSRFADLIDMKSKNNPRPFKVVTGYKNLEDLHRRMSNVSFIIKKEECLDLPKKIYQKFYVELTPDQKRMYDELKKLSMSEIEGELVSVKIVLTKLLKLHQLVCGHVKDDDGTVHAIPHNRVKALMDIMEETQGQVLIWANYRDDIFAIEKALKAAYGEKSTLTYFGETSAEDRDLVKHVFRKGNDTKGYRFMVGNTQTGGYGITLTGATTVIYYSNNFDAEKRNQSEDRCHRIGQTDSVTYIDLVVKGTVDERILQALKSKKELSDIITESNWKNMF